MIKNFISKIEKKMSLIENMPLIGRGDRSSLLIPSDEAISKYKAVQRLAYNCAVDIAKEIQVGWSEKKTAQLMDVYLKDHGVKCFFHRSFAWFGDRTRFQNFNKYRHFLPSEKTVTEKDIIILDTAPILNGFAGDIGYTCALDKNLSQLKEAREVLSFFRKEIPLLFSLDLTPAEICKRVDSKVKELGFDNCHSMYPFQVLGHRLPQTAFGSLPGLTIPFSWQAFWALSSRGLYNELLGPHHIGKKSGVWAIEPHLGGEGFGFKFEEILIVEDGHAYWLDDDVPHNRS